MTFTSTRALVALFAMAAIAAAPLPAAAVKSYYFYPDGAADAADATIQAEQPFPYENREPIDTALEAVAVDAPAPEFIPLKKMRRGATVLSAVHVLPGTYRVRAACESGAYNDMFVSEPIAIEAGQEYFVECRGQTRDQVKVSVSSQPSEVWHGVRGIRAKSVELPAGFSPDKVGADLERALRGRGWEITATSPGQIDATLHVREHVAVIRAIYDEHKVTFSYVDSTNLEYLVEDGVASVHRNYYNWINYLGTDLLTYLRGEIPQI